jgi:hypothetical protein
VDILILCATKHETGSRPLYRRYRARIRWNPWRPCPVESDCARQSGRAFAVCRLEAAKQLATVHAFFNQFAHSHLCAVLNCTKEELCEKIPSRASCLPDSSRRALVAHAIEDSPASEAHPPRPEKRDGHQVRHASDCPILARVAINLGVRGFADTICSRKIVKAMHLPSICLN